VKAVPAPKADWVWMDGEIVAWAEAKIHVASEALLRGANVFEGERAYWSAEHEDLYIFRHAEHLRRLRQSARIMRMQVPYTDAELTAGCIELIRRHGWRDSVHVRPVVYFGEGEQHAFRPEDIRTGVFILAFRRPSRPSVETGIRSCVSTWRRNPDNAAPSRIKAAANYHNGRLAQVEATLAGFGTPIMLNMAGKVAESPGSCFMMVRDGTVITPPVTADILEGITRATLIQLFREAMGVPVVERDIDRSELYVCDEAFFCGSGQEVQPIVAVDHYEIGDARPGPVTRGIQALYFDVVRGKHKPYRSWLTPVYGGGPPVE
jgi:branched-chain amino acid aminotransferase